VVRPDPIPFVIGDVVRLKKPHPCGGFDWTVVRLGADIGLKCLSCGRRVLLPRREVERRLKQFVERAAVEPPPTVASDIGSGESSH
jgi:hypothetical protein